MLEVRVKCYVTETVLAVAKGAAHFDQQQNICLRILRYQSQLEQQPFPYN